MKGKREAVVLGEKGGGADLEEERMERLCSGLLYERRIRKKKRKENISLFSLPYYVLYLNAHNKFSFVRRKLIFKTEFAFQI